MTKIDHGNLAQKLQRVADHSPDLVNRAVAESGEDLLSKSIPRTPLEHGELRQSGYVEHSPGRAEVGFSAPHAYIVHQMSEDFEFTTPGTSGKYLEGPFLENKKKYADHVKQAAREALHG